MTAQILQFESRLTIALKKACRNLNTLYDYGYCDETAFFEVMEELDRRIVETESRIQ